MPRCGSCYRPIAWIAEAGDDTFAEVVEQATLPVLVDFWAPWCAPCRTVSPVLDELAADFAGRVKLVKVNVDEAPGLTDRFVIRHIPSLMIMDHGRKIAFQPGAAPRQALRDWVAKALEQRHQSASAHGRTE
jgi:thioredoxin 2